MGRLWGLSPLGGKVQHGGHAVSRGIAIAVVAVLLLLPSCGTAQNGRAAGAKAGIVSGIQQLQAGNFEKAKVEFTAAIEADPHSADALTWRGICENRLGQYQEALNDLRAALRIDPHALPARYNLALTEIRLGQTDAAIEGLEAFVKAQPGAVDAQYNLAILLEKKRSIAEAVEHLRVAERAQPGDLVVDEHLLLDDLALGDSVEAQQILERLRTANVAPEDQVQIGNALVGAGHFSEAAALIESARSRLPASKSVDLLLARAYIGARKYTDAIRLLKPSEGKDANGDAAYLLGLAYGASGATEQAEEAFQAAARANPRDPRPLFHLGMLDSTVPERRQLALENLRRAVQLDPQNASYAIGLSKLQLEANDPKGAIKVLQDVHAGGVEAAERSLLLGIAQVTVNGAAAAIPTLQHAIQLDPAIALSHNVLGFCYFSRGDYAHAAGEYRQASNLSPSTLLFAYDTALAYERANQLKDALVYAKRAVSLPSARAEDHYLVGKLYAESGHKQEAIRELEIAVQMNPSFDDPYYLLARTYMKMGDRAKAVAWNQKLTALKQEQARSYAAQKSSRPSQMSSSSLLHGESLTSDQEGNLEK